MDAIHFLQLRVHLGGVVVGVAQHLHDQRAVRQCEQLGILSGVGRKVMEDV